MIQKVKLGMAASQDGGIPLLFQPWVGSHSRQSDGADEHAQPASVPAAQRAECFPNAGGGRSGANLTVNWAFAYQGFQSALPVAGLGKLEKVHKELILAPEEQRFTQMPLTEKTDQDGYWGVACAVPFTHNGRTITHRGLVVLSGPMQQAYAKTRRQDLKNLQVALHQIRAAKSGRSVIAAKRRSIVALPLS